MADAGPPTPPGPTALQRLLAPQPPVQPVQLPTPPAQPILIQPMEPVHVPQLNR